LKTNINIILLSTPRTFDGFKVKILLDNDNDCSKSKRFSHKRLNISCTWLTVNYELPYILRAGYGRKGLILGQSVGFRISGVQHGAL
jgi:hypothetical protein